MKFFFNIFSTFAVIFHLICCILSYDYDCSNIYIYSILIFIINVALYLIAGITYQKSIYSFWLRPTYIVLICLVIVNLQTILNVLFKFRDLHFYLYTDRFNDVFGNVLFLSLFAISSFLISNFNYNPSKNIYQSKKYNNNYISSTYWTIFLIVIFLLFVLTSDINSLISGASYIGSGAYDRVNNSSAYFEQLLKIGFIVFFALYSHNNIIESKEISFITYIKHIPIALKIVLIVYLILKLFSGDRGPIITNTLIIIFSYLLSSKVRLKFTTVIIILIISTLTISLLGITRGLNTDISFSDRFAASYEKFENIEKAKYSISPLTQELANSVNCNFIAIDDVKEEKTDLKYGEYTTISILSSIPGSRYILTNIFNLNLRNSSSAEYLTTSYFGSRYNYGLGTTPLAESYLDFGILGVFITFFVIGYLYKYIDYIIISNRNFSMSKIILVLIFASNSVYLPRASFTDIIAFYIYTMIVYSILNLLYNKFFRKA